MSKDGGNKTANEICNSVIADLQAIVRYMPIIVPADKLDEKALAIGKDMFECMIKDIQTGHVDEVLDMDLLMQDWAELSVKIQEKTQLTEIHKVIDHIVSLYDVKNEGDDDSDE